ncbi:MAG TPA: protein translocase subunit SecD [Candidatus Paceibacterota bacterium]|nr:protein translocase subunit SecD [Candidatus Paceibacterota bacterium]
MGFWQLLFGEREAIVDRIMLKKRIWALVLIIVAALVGYFAFVSTTYPFHLGLDLSGGSYLVYSADTSKVAPTDVDDRMNALVNDVEKRVNVFGVSEPIVQTEVGGTIGNSDHRLIVELPGVTDITQAEAIIGKTPSLDFMLVGSSTPAVPTLNLSTESIKNGTLTLKAIAPTTTPTTQTTETFIPTGLTGQLVSHADVEFDPTTYQPYIALTWNSDGATLFDQVTKANVGQRLAIFLDGTLIEAPVIQQEISGGNAQITGDFTLDQVKATVNDLNLGALPVPITLISTQTIGATLGESALHASILAGIIAFIIVGLFLILFYRLPGLVAVLALAIYTAINLAIYRFIPVTLTSAGIAGFILSIGMAVDANILIFERTKEEIARGRTLPDAIREGFHRAWNSIRDSNLSSIITAIILYYFASTPIVRGFALVFLIGVLVSMFSAITATRTLLLALGVEKENKVTKFLFGSGLSNKLQTNKLKS